MNAIFSLRFLYSNLLSVSRQIVPGWLHIGCAAGGALQSRGYFDTGFFSRLELLLRI